LLVYLDQNTLSDLRHRKIEEADKLDNKVSALLKLILSSSEVTVVYSYVTLSEILQIRVEKYRNEHIDPLTKKLVDFTAKEVWLSYLNKIEINKGMGIKNLCHTVDLISKKLSGLPVEDSFVEIDVKKRFALKNLLLNAEKGLATLQVEMSCEKWEEINELKLKASASNYQVEKNVRDFGPNPFRDMLAQNGIEISKLPIENVINIILTMLEREYKYIWTDHLENTPQNCVSMSYTLMNWAGYYADDFTKIKNKSDRFNASSNDMQHAMSAIGINVLLSNDNRFLIITKACFSYIKQDSIVCTPKEFLYKHCKIILPSEDLIGSCNR